MKVRIVSYEDLDLWILGKFAKMMQKELTSLGVACDIAKVPDPSADINHHIHYYYYDGKPSSIDTVMVTHIDADWKLEQVRNQLKVASSLGICMSAQTVDMLANCGIPREKLCYVLPAHDQVMKPRPLAIGVTSKIHSDGRKRETMLAQLADHISPQDFMFKIMGAGWDLIVDYLRSRGFAVDYHDAFDYELNKRLVPTFDYYLYLGLDEGAMGFIDALAAGVPTIVTPQGYHLDAPNGITHPFVTFEELVGVLKNIAGKRKVLTDAVEDWTWREYSRRHLEIWEYLLYGKHANSISSSRKDGFASMQNAQNPPGETQDVKPKSVMIACSHFWPSIGGLENRVGQFSAELVKNGYDVSILTPCFPGRNSDVRNGVKIISVDPAAVIDGFPAWPYMVRKSVSSDEYDTCIVIQDPLGNIIWSVENIIRPPKTKLIIQPIINPDGYSKWNEHPEFGKRLAAILSSADAAVAMTKSGTENQFMRGYGITPVYLPNASSVPAPDGDFRKRYSISEDRFVILHVANLYRVKNHTGLLDAMRNLPDSWLLVLVGNASGEPDYAHEVMKKLAERPDVLYIPGLSREGVSGAMVAADVVVLSSFGEGSPNTILEAMAQGKPWLATPQCGAVNDNAGGIICELSSFKKYLSVLHENPHLRKALGGLGHLHWKNSYSWPKVVAGWIDLIETGSLHDKFEMPDEIKDIMDRINSQISVLLQHTAHIILPESRHAHHWLDGLRGLEIGPAAQNQFGLNTRFVGIRDEIYEEEQLRQTGSVISLDIEARADSIPLPDESEDFVFSSHVIEHCPDVITTLLEWYRIVRTGGIIYMIVPLRDAAKSDVERDITSWSHILVDFNSQADENSDPEAGRFGHCHYHVFDIQSMREIMENVFGHRLQLVDFLEKDDKIGNGFTLVYRKTDKCNDALSWEFWRRFSARRALLKLNDQGKTAFVNIGMITFNRLEFTRQAITALANIPAGYDYSLTVIDNASTDGTREYLKEQKRLGIIKNLVMLNENVGVAKASNLAWSLEPEAAYYLKLDNDIVIQQPGWLLEMIRVVEAVTEAGAVAYNFETTSYESATAYGVQFRPKSSGNLGGACILIPKRTHDLLGYWCEDYGLYGEEDADYGARIRTAGLFNIYMEDEQIGLHLPAGRAAIIDNTLTARDGIEEETYSEYRAWKDDARRLNVLSGRYIRNVESYAQREGAVHLDSAFVRAWHDKQSIKADKKADRGTVDVPVTIHCSKPKIGVFASAPLHCACPQLRLISALACLHEAGELEYVDVARLLENAPATFVEELVGMSALILQRSKIAFWPYEGLGPLLEKTGTKLILEVDDAVMQVPKANPLYEHFQSMQHEFEEYFRHADLITVSTPYLQELYSHYNHNVIVLPNCIDTTVWKCEPPCVPTKSRLPLKILFSGTPSHVEDFAVLREAIYRILDEFPKEVELIVWGNMIPEFLTHPSVRFIENYVNDYSHYAQNLIDLKADIGIVPLVDNVFNNAKSAIKWLEYSVCGIAGIFSNVGEYKDVVKHGKTGLIVENNEADWYAAIKELILNRQLRTSIAKAAYSDVMTKHTVVHNAHKWLEAYRSSGCIPGACASAGAITVSPCESEINAAIRFHQAGQLAKAEPMYRNILAAEPDNFDALHLLGVLAYQSGRLDESLELLSKTIQKHRSHPSAFISLGNTLTSLNRYNEAAEYYHQALELEPDNAGIHYNLGNVLHFLDRNEEAVSWYQKALTIKPDFIEVHNHLGNALRKLGRLKEAEASLRLALKLNADVSGVHNNLGNVLMDLGRLDEAEASFRHALKLKPNYFVAHSNLLFVQNYSACHDIDSHLELARSYGRMVGKDVAARFTSWNCPQPPKPLRVGLVSGDFNNHPVGFFLEDVLAHVDTSRIELIAYCTQRKCDDLTARIMPFFSEWRQLEGLDDESAAHLIHKDCVHVLIDLAGHTAYNRLPVFAWKPAPVQVSWLGYSSTTGVSEIDYILGNPYSTPTKESHHFTETIWQLPETSLCFSFPNLNLDVAQLPALSNGFITFGCFNNLAKLNDGVLSVWANILKALPASRLFLKNKQLGESSARMEIINRFAAYGVSEDRLLLEGRSPRLEYLRAYNSVDIVLDPFPFPGGTTTVEGLWMGVPFVTKQGHRFISHQGEMIAQNTGLLAEWIAKDDEEYLAKAIYFSSNLEYLAGLRTIFRRHLHLSPLFDAPRFARHLEQALWGMWDGFEMNK